jgi:tetratricopeptide (TPR) repeat protein
VMTDKRLKNIFYITSAMFLFLLVISSRKSGITCDEILHYNHSVSVYNYFASHGKDTSALNTAVTHLKYYGQSYDNLVTILTRWFNVEDIYGFRNLMSSIAGWLAIFITALFAVWLTGYRAGILTLILFAVSPTFIGHTQNNLKDIPFALGYIATTFFTLKFLVSGSKNSILNIILLTAGIAFTISIRAGGLLLICFLYLFFIIFYLIKYMKDKKVDYIEIRSKFLFITAISIVSWLLSTLLWPFAIQNPVKNVIESYFTMAHYPGTFRQIFEGKVEWSDYMPWYYLLKSMAITIPIIILTGLLIFSFYSIKGFNHRKNILYGFIVFTVLFPIIFVIYEKSNLYSSWRQFLFLYPAIVLLAATGFIYLFDQLKNKYINWFVVVLLAALSVHPLKFIIKNYPYSYIYYNQLIGGIRGAYGNYETDYYYVSQTEASKWLIEYLNNKKDGIPVKIKATYPVQWLFRKHPEIETSFFRYEERSLSDWDYAIVVNRYITPYQLRNNIWPPKNTIHLIYADTVPICAVIERRSKDDYNGYNALTEGRFKDAIRFFQQVLQIDDMDEMIYYNYAASLYHEGLYQKADSVLKRGLVINPDFEPILMYLGNIARFQQRTEEAIMYYEKLITINKKYYEAYIGLSELIADKNILKARALLRSCLTMSPHYKPAIVALANTYRNSDPDIARKYDDLAKSIKP